MPFARILRSSALMGASQVVMMLAGFARNKLIAVFIGPGGVGLMGIMSSYNLNVSTLCGLGIGVSGVRLVSSAEGEARMVKVAAVRRFGSILAWIALVVMVATFIPISRWTYQSPHYDQMMFVAGLAIPCVVMTTMWSALLLAAGEVKSVAKNQIVAAVLGLLLGAPLIYIYGEIGIAWSVLLAALSLAFVTWRAAAQHCPSSLPPESMPEDIRMMAKVGGAFMVGELLGQVAVYFVRMLILRAHGDDLKSGLADAGYYHAALTVTGILPGFVFGAMGADFFPRVSAAKTEEDACDISEKQIKASLLLALPGLIGILTVSKPLVVMLYASAFAPAVPLVPWFVWAIFFNLLGWPLAYWLAARAEPGKVLTLKLLGNAVMPLSALLMIPAYGLPGAAGAYFLSSVCFAGLTVWYVRARVGRWLHGETIRWLCFAALALLASQWVIEIFPHSVLRFFPLILATAACGYVYMRLVQKETATKGPSP
jgi:PST family polysaccharide transporter